MSDGVDRSQHPAAPGGGASPNSPERPEATETAVQAVPPVPDLYRGPGLLPRSIGRYRVLGKLGEGGMGIVYEAEQEHPRRRVALKIVRGGAFVDETRLRMFQREADTLARLKHPNIGAIFEAGRTEEGQHFFAMELVLGPSLDRFLAERRPPDAAEELRTRLALFRTICDAVHHAHLRGVIHRDLKPSNIIVARDEHDGTHSGRTATTVKVLDFGLARITDADVRGATLLTEVGIIKGTLPYMSPEQTTGDPAAIDIRTDVYSLGVILYEMVTARRPYCTEGVPLVEAIRAIRDEPPAPLRRRGNGTGKLDPDVETIVLKALEKDPRRRYESVAALSQDIDRHLASEPILARPPSVAYQVRKFAARNKVLVGGVLATVVVLAAGVLVSSMLGIREVRHRRAAELSRAEAERTGYVAGVAAAEAGLRLFELGEVKRRLAACPPALRGWEWEHLSFRSDMSEKVVAGHAWRVYAVAASPDGRLYASGAADPDTTIRLWDAATGRQLSVLEGHKAMHNRTAAIRSIAFSPDGARLASASDDMTVRIWDTADGRERLVLRGHEDGVSDVAFSTDGAEVFSASTDGTVRRWRSSDGRQTAVLRGHAGAVRSVAVCGDGSRVASAGSDHRVRIWDRATGKQLLELHTAAAAMGLACSPDGSTLAGGLQDGTVHLWNTDSGAELGTPGRHDDVVIRVAFSPDGRTFATTSKDRTVRLWNSSTCALLATLVGHDDYVTAVAFEPGGRRLLTGSADRTLRVWSADPTRAVPVLASRPGPTVGLAVTPDGARVVTASKTDGIRVWRASSGAQVSAAPGPTSPITRFAASSGGELVAALCEDSTIHVWALLADGSLTTVAHRTFESSSGLAFRPGSKELLVGSSVEGRIRRWEPLTGREPGEIRIDGGWIRVYAASPDGSLLVCAGGTTRAPIPGNKYWLVLLDLRSGRIVARREIRHSDPSATGGSPVIGVAFSPDGRRIATSHAQDYSVRLWDAFTLEPLATRLGHTEIASSVAFSPDGKRVISGGWDYTVRFWDGSTGEPLLALRTGQVARVLAVAFSPDGGSVFSANEAGTTHIWRTRR